MFSATTLREIVRQHTISICECDIAIFFFFLKNLINAVKKNEPPLVFCSIYTKPNQSGLGLLHALCFRHDETVMSCYSAPSTPHPPSFFPQLALPFISHPDCIQIFIIHITFIPGIKIAPRLANVSAVSAAIMAF